MSMAHFRCPSCGGVNRIPREKVDHHPTCGRCKAELDTSGRPVHLGDDALETLIGSSPVPVLVDFYADWCGPCRALAPVLEQLGAQNAGRLMVVKVDTERDQRVASRLGVRGIPAVYLYKGGRVVAEQAGAAPLPFWQKLVAPHLEA